MEDRGVSTRVGLLTPDAKGMDLVLTVVREFMALICKKDDYIILVLSSVNCKVSRLI